jgi:hypothetical protein
MAILLHVLSAVIGLIVTSLAYFSPSKATLRAAYVLAGLTLATGSYLLWLSPAHLVQACITGLVYDTFVIFGIVSARRKLASVTINNR